MAGIYRRICLLRASGRLAEAERLQLDEFVTARSAAQQETHLDESPESESLINSLLEAEEARVTEALLFAEMLAPMIAEHIRPDTAAELSASRPPFSSDRANRPIPPPRAPSDAAPSIADLIDGMLGQENNGRRSP